MTRSSMTILRAILAVTVFGCVIGHATPIANSPSPDDDALARSFCDPPLRHAFVSMTGHESPRP